MRLILSLVLLLIVPALASAQLRFVRPSIDLGELRGGPNYAYRFDFVNDADQPIEILDFRLGCGCLQPVIEKRVFNAGEKATLVMNLRTLGQQDGPRTWRVLVQYRLGKQILEAGLVVAATLRSEVTVEPSVVAMTIETSLRQEVIVRDLRTTPSKVITVLASSPAVRVMTQPLGNGATKIILEVSAASLKAPQQEETLNIYTDDPMYRHLQIPLTLAKATRASVTASPETVEIVGAGSQLVRLRSANDQPVRIDKVDADHAALKCTWAAGPGNDATLKIAAGQVSADAKTSVRVQVGASTIVIPVVLRKE